MSKRYFHVIKYPFLDNLKHIFLYQPLFIPHITKNKLIANRFKKSKIYDKNYIDPPTYE